MKHIKRGTLPILICILLILSFALARREARMLRDGITVHVVDVGQADCMVIESEDGNIIIDTGTDISEKSLRAYLRSHGLTSFSYMILSHPHDDHIGNADMLLREFSVARVISADSASEEAVWKNFLGALEESRLFNQTEWIKPAAGSVYYVGRVRVEVLAVPKEENAGENDDSLLVRVDYGDCSMLLTGDAEQAAEEQFLLSCPAEKLKADLLKVGHHGSSGATSMPFLQAVSPGIAVISCGRGNSFSHPHEEVLNRLRVLNVDVYRTDIHGSLRFFCDGNTFEIKSLLTS